MCSNYYSRGVSLHLTAQTCPLKTMIWLLLALLLGTESLHLPLGKFDPPSLDEIHAVRHSRHDCVQALGDGLGFTYVNRKHAYVRTCTTKRCGAPGSLEYWRTWHRARARTIGSDEALSQEAFTYLGN